MFSISESLLLVIDVQGRLARLVDQKQQLFENICGLIVAAHNLSIPLIVTEQCPDKIGKTIPEVEAVLNNNVAIIKSSFSCCGSSEFNDTLKKNARKQIIVCGIETHVCVYQTVYDLKQSNYQVQVVADAVSSRTRENKDIGLQRVRQLGVGITSMEMILTELLRTAEHSKFRDIIKLIR